MQVVEKLHLSSAKRVKIFVVFDYKKGLEISALKFSNLSGSVDRKYVDPSLRPDQGK